MILLEKSYWEVKTTKKKGEGLFAKKNLQPGIVIGDYLGKVLRTSEVDITGEKESFYLMYYHDQASIYPDLTKPGIHLLNHSCEPNCAFFTYQGHILFFTLRHIFLGEELTVAYMLSPKDSFCEPCNHICKCESKFCSRSMHLPQDSYVNWRYFQETQNQKTKRKRVTYNKNLSPLTFYPKLIPDNPIYNLFGITKKTSKILSVSKLPSIDKLRKLIKTSGKTLEFPKLNKRIIGIVEGKIKFESIRN